MRLTLLALLICGASGCEQGRDEPNASNDVLDQPETATVRDGGGVLPGGWDAWSAKTAQGKLGQARFAAAAALRLVRLAELEDLDVLKAPLSAADARALRVVEVAPLQYVLGRAQLETADAGDRPTSASMNGVDPDPEFAALEEPIRVSVLGLVERLIPMEADPTGGVFFESRDRWDMPTIVVGRDRVLTHNATWVTAIQLSETEAKQSRVAFQHDPDADSEAIMLMPLEGASDRVIARYLWDSIEERFIGPGSDYLEGDSGEAFNLDLSASTLLIPQGGIIPEEEPLPDHSLPDPAGMNLPA